MEALFELCDLIAENPTAFYEKLSWICSRCPPPDALLAESPRVSRSQLNAILAIARFLSKCADCFELRPKAVVLEFIRSIPSSFHPSFWPQTYGNDSITLFYTEFLRYVSRAAEITPDFSAEVAVYTGEVVASAISSSAGDSSISRSFLMVLSKHFFPVLPSDANKIVEMVIERFLLTGSCAPREHMQGNSDSSAFHSIEGSSPQNGGEDNISSWKSSASSYGSGVLWKSSADQLGSMFGFNDGGGGGEVLLKQQVAIFEEESLECVEKQAIAFELLAHILDKARIDSSLWDQARSIAKKQLQSLLIFVKIRKRDWNEQGSVLKARINAKLLVYQAAAKLKLKSLGSLDNEGKVAKKLVFETFALLMDAAEACILSIWRKLRVCEELFSCLLAVLGQIAVAWKGQPLRVLLIRLKPLVLTVCAQTDPTDSSQNTMFETVSKTMCEIVESCWTKERAPVDTFIMGLTASIRGRNDYEEQVNKEREVPPLQLNGIRLLANLNVAVKKPEIVDMILPLFIESLEEGDASTPCVLRLQFLDAVSRMASLGFEKSYRETVVLMTRSYLSKLSNAASAPPESGGGTPEATTERLETLPAGFFLIASGLANPKLRSDYRYRLLSLCSDVGLAADSRNSSGADFLGPLLPAVAEICSDFSPTGDVEPSLLKLFRNLWFYVALFGLAPPIQNSALPSKAISTTVSTAGSIGTTAIQAVSGPYMWDKQWSAAVQLISQGTPPLVVSTVKWLEDELELNALQNPVSRQGTANDKVVLAQRAALATALGGRVDISAMSTISGVKATYLLAVSFLEITRFSSNGGILNGSISVDASRSAISCVFEYLKTPNLVPAVLQCLTALVHRAYETAVSWLEHRISDIGNEAAVRNSILNAHTCFLIKSMCQREDHIREVAVTLLTQFRDRFPQVMWNSSCLDSLLFSMHNHSPTTIVNDPAWVVTVRSLYQKVVREWIIRSLSFAPCTSQGLLQEMLCKANTWQRAQHTPDVVSLLSEIRIGTGKNECWTGVQTANIPAVMAAAAAASGGNLNLTKAFNLEVLSTGIGSATVKCNYVGEIAGMRRLYNTFGGYQSTGTAPAGSGIGIGLQRLITGAFPQEPQAAEDESFNAMLLLKFVQSLQKFVNNAETGGEIDKSQFHETCSQATAFLLANLDNADSKSNIEGLSQLLRLLCWCPAYISRSNAMETGVFVWTWLVSAAPQLGCIVLAELVDAWLWTIDTKRGLFSSKEALSGPTAKLRPHLYPGDPELPPEFDPVEQIIAHRLWLGFFFDRFEVVRYQSVEQLLLFGRLLQGSIELPWKFSHHPAATGSFFTLMFLGLKFCSCQTQVNLRNFETGLRLLEDRVYRASLGWFSFEPEWHDINSSNFAQSEAQSVALFAQYLSNSLKDGSQIDVKGQVRENGNSADQSFCHPVWGPMDNYAVGREKRRQLLLMLCQHEADRLEVWANPVNTKETTSLRPKISSEKWIEYARTAYSVDPRIAFSLVSRFPANVALRSEVSHQVQSHILDIRSIPEALPYFVSPKAVDENSVLLQQLPHWAACSIVQAIEFIAPSYKGHPRVMAYVLRVLESYPPERVTFFMPQLVQALRHDDGKLVEGYLLRAAQRSDIFSHILIWHLQGETCEPETAGKDATVGKMSAFQALLPVVRQKIIDGFSPSARDIFQREFDFFDKVTSISGVLFPIPKDERRAGIRKELEKIEMDGDDLYLPTAPGKLVRGIQVDSGIPLQSAAKVPIMITFNVIDRDGDHNDIKPQACIFKVGDDCRQDVLALQVISLLRDVFEAVGLSLYLFPYGVLPTGPERGIIEVVPNVRSRSQMGETTDGGLYEIFQQDYGPVGSPSFEAARENFIISSAGYAVASLLLQPKDRHNGNLLFDNLGRLIHIDFGFILETSPGGNMRFESAHFKLSHEMTQLLDPSGVMKSETWNLFLSLCVKGYLSARRYMDGILTTVALMLDSGLPCFSRGDPIGNLRKRFHPEMSEREAANFMIRVCVDAYNKWTTAGYDLIQYLQQGIEK
ncbi:phosphatidylinositol 4-kinase alpha 1-like isoform X2 [Cucurbita moschata]|uniref:1-phosphatidylinositol 4-kinase n=1 Tax=Cucurbita moschata TaxID=3662 RepID=A0A6J1G7F1_CUCMO|nr:phosphatidylinositol 4-kinase alpha 1-like isoform X2 [Cucurbita moschata]